MIKRDLSRLIVVSFNLRGHGFGLCMNLGARST